MHGETVGEGDSLAQNLGVLGTAALGRLDFSRPCASSKIVTVRPIRKGWPGQQATWQTRLNRNGLLLKDEQRGNEAAS